MDDRSTLTGSGRDVRNCIRPIKYVCKSIIFGVVFISCPSQFVYFGEYNERFLLNKKYNRMDYGFTNHYLMVNFYLKGNFGKNLYM